MTHEVLRVYTIHSNVNDLLCITALVDDIKCTDPGSAWSDPPRSPAFSPAVCTAFVDADYLAGSPSTDQFVPDQQQPHLCDLITDLNLDWTINS